MDSTLVVFLLGVENRAVEMVKSALYGWTWFKALNPAWQTPIIILIAAIIGSVLAIVFGLNLLVNVPNFTPIVGEIASGVALSFGSAGVQRLLDLVAAWTATKQAQAADIRAQTTTPMAGSQGESLKTFSPPSDFSEVELRAIAHSLGVLPPGNISRDGLVMAILAATAPKAAT